jgi:hypothetical protein
MPAIMKPKSRWQPGAGECALELAVEGTRFEWSTNACAASIIFAAH